jgi:diguanylate cyclase (GGDEF)-like protein
MQAPSLPDDEDARLAALHALQLLDTTAEDRFDRVTRVACRTFGVPVALVSLVDGHRQWFKSRVGLGASETPREVSFCGHAILTDAAFVVPDAHLDPRFADNPLVTGSPHVRFYAGQPLRAAGYRIGTLCLLDRSARDFGPDEARLLGDLAAIVEQEIALQALAMRDELTGLANRRGFRPLATQALALCRRLGKPASLLFFDLDGFKAINDTHGHAAGDQALRRFAMLMRGVFRASDVLGRLGGDEFAALLVDTGEGRGEVALERLVAATQDITLPQPLRFSVGAVSCLAPDSDLDTLMVEADNAMYERKRAARRHPA